MELLFLILYSIGAWLIFFKFKWLPWNITSQVITVTIPVFLLAIVILLLNIAAPSSADERVINYVVQVVPRGTKVRIVRGKDVPPPDPSASPSASAGPSAGSSATPAP